jgi:hypothetical protein
MPLHRDRRRHRLVTPAGEGRDVGVGVDHGGADPGGHPRHHLAGVPAFHPQPAPMLGQGSIECGQVTGQHGPASRCHPIPQARIDDEQGGHLAPLGGGRRPGRVVPEAEVAPEPGERRHQARLGGSGKNPLVRRMYSSYSGRRRVIVFSSNPAPEYLTRRAVITSGPTTVHHAPPATATR